MISGHQRVRAAGLLGWPDIEARVVEADDISAARMLISANIKTRALSPMELARAIRREKELIALVYGHRQGQRTDLTAGDEFPLLAGSSTSGQNGPKLNSDNFRGRWSEEVAKEIGKSEKTIRRFDKLNDLIPILQSLVDEGKLSVTVAEQLAYLAPEEQQALFNAFGDAIGKQTLVEVKEIRRQMEAESAARESAEAKVSEWQSEAERLREELSRAQNAAHEARDELERQLDEARRKLGEAERELAERPRVEVVSETVKQTLEELRRQNEDLRATLAARDRTEEKLREEKAAALEAKRMAEQMAEEERARRERLEKTITASGSDQTQYQMMRNLESKLVELNKDVVGMLGVWQPEGMEATLLHHFESLLEQTAARLRELARRCAARNSSSNVVMMTRREK
ncbi:MAG: chromosome partitioning protein ParB [Alicyclobacillaceae bacterium]|nr:chromosome partitioning protein ParB [Alicyclobacillaceae bacterium]